MEKDKQKAKDQKKKLSQKQQGQLKAELQECRSCLQNTHQYDYDKKPAEELLEWRIGAFSQKSRLWVPSGNECGLCFSTRRRYFDDSQEALVANFKTIAGLQAKFNEYRAARANGDNKFSKDARVKSKDFFQ